MKNHDYTPPTDAELEGVAHTRLLCPLESCDWFLVQEEADPKDVAADALLRIRRGEHAGDPVSDASSDALALANWRDEQRILAHLRKHDPMEWVRELTSLRARLTAALEAATSVADAASTRDMRSHNGHSFRREVAPADMGAGMVTLEEAAEALDPSRPRWNGIPVEAVRGSGVVLDSPAFPQFWARGLVGARIAVVRIKDPRRGTIYIDDREGQGWDKVTHGGGPSIAHGELDVAAFALDGEEPGEDPNLCECGTEVAVTSDVEGTPLGEDCLRELQQMGDGA